MNRSTVNSYLNGKPVDYLNFVEISEKLGFNNWQEIAASDFDNDRVESTEENDVQQLEESSPIALSTCSSFPDCSKNFYGRKNELSTIETQIQESRVVVMYGEPAVGKTDLASQLAKQLSKDYEICWIEPKGEEKLTLEELLLQIGEFLKVHGEQGFVTTYAKEKEAGLKITLNNKVDTLVTVISEISKRTKYLFFLENFQQFEHSHVNYLIERFLAYGEQSRIIIIDRSPSRSLGISLFSKVQHFSVKGFNQEDTEKYIQKLCQDYRIGWTEQDIRQIFEKTDGHPQAITFIIVCAATLGESLKNVLENIVAFDKQDSSQLSQKLLQDVAKNLDSEEKQALQHLSLFRNSFQPSVKDYLNISVNVWNSLVQYRWLKSDRCGNFQMHSLIAEFWRSFASESEDISPWHEKIAKYHWNQGQASSLEYLDRRSYLESHYHWKEINKIEEAAQVLNELISRIHKQERLPSERLPRLRIWLLSLDKIIIQNKPWLLVEKGRKLEKNNNFKEARICFNDAYQIFNNQQDHLGSSVALYYVGKMRYLMREYKAALETLELVLGMVENDHLMQIRTLGKMVTCYMQIGQEQEAKIYADRAEMLARECEDNLGLALVLYRQGTIKRRQSHFPEAEKYFNESAKLFKDLGDVYRQSKSLVRLGICQQFQGKYQDAEHNLKHAIKLKKSINDLPGLARDIDYLADIDNRQGFYDNAKQRYLESLEIKKGNTEIQRDDYGLIKSYNNLAKLALSTNHFEEAKSWIEKSKELISQQKKPPINLEGTRLRLQGELQFAQGDYEAALQAYQEAEKCFVPPNPIVPHSQALIHLSLGRIYLIMGNLDLAQKNLELADKIFADPDCEMTYHRILALTYQARLYAWFNPQNAHAKNQDALNLAEKKGIQSILITCLETQGIIEENKILETVVEHLTEEEKTQKLQALIAQVGNYYDRVMDDLKKIDKSNNYKKDITRLRVKKYLWQFTIKYFCQTQSSPPISLDDAYQLLKSDLFVKEILRIHLITIKHQVNNLAYMNQKIARKFAEISLQIIAPIAMRFGFNELREEIENRSFAFLYPEEYYRIQYWLEQRYPNREGLIQELHSELEDALGEAEISAEIYPRIKTPYSIYKKLIHRRVSLEKILDVVGFRLITQNKDDCYGILKIVQNIGSFFEGRGVLKEPLRDYIKAPKETTGYQSIHINILYGEPEHQIIEFQIRTESMHLAAEYGTSAFGLDKSSHTYYKRDDVYSHASCKKNYELAARFKINILIECSRRIIQNVVEIIQASKFDIFSLDDIYQSIDNRIIIKLELIAKSARLNENTQLEETAKGSLHQLEKKLNDFLENEERLKNFKDDFLEFHILDKDSKNNDFPKVSLSLNEKASLIQELTHHFSQENRAVYVVTPKGDIKKLFKPNSKNDDNNKCREITCIDFAYAIHEEVGYHCYGAKVNGRMVKVNTPLKDGDVVEIITRKNSYPSYDWLNFAATNSARNKIRRGLKKIARQENIIKGRELLYKELQKELKKQEIDRFLKSEQMEELLKEYNYNSLETFFAALGYQDISLNAVANQIVNSSSRKHLSRNEEVSSESKASSKTVNKRQTKCAIKELDGIRYEFASCCQPIPDEPIIGIVSGTSNGETCKGIVIHHQSCDKWKNIPDERHISLTWNETREQTYPVKIRIEMNNRVGLLKDILSPISDAHINVFNLEPIDYSSDGIAVITLVLDLHDREELERILTKLKNMKEHISVYRVRAFPQTISANKVEISN